MEKSILESIVHELEQEAPVLANIRKNQPNPIPEGYDDGLAEQVMGSVRLALWQTTAKNHHAHARSSKPADEYNTLYDADGLTEKILPNLLKSVESTLSGQANTSIQPVTKHMIVQKQFVHRLVYAVAACTLVVISTLAIRYLLEEPKSYGASEQLTVDESMAFLEANLEEMEMEDLIEWGVLEQEDLEIHHDITHISENDTL